MKNNEWRVIVKYLCAFTAMIIIILGCCSRIIENKIDALENKVEIINQNQGSIVENQKIMYKYEQKIYNKIKILNNDPHNTMCEQPQYPETIEELYTGGTM